jgi:hypothetical protein
MLPVLKIEAGDVIAIILGVLVAFIAFFALLGWIKRRRGA